MVTNPPTRHDVTILIYYCFCHLSKEEEDKRIKQKIFIQKELRV